MDGIGHKLSIGRGMKQAHYAAIQIRIMDDIERLKKELEENKEDYKSCVDCNLIFHKDKLTDGTCHNCIEEVLRRR